MGIVGIVGKVEKVWKCIYPTVPVWKCIYPTVPVWNGIYLTVWNGIYPTVWNGIYPLYTPLTCLDIGQSGGGVGMQEAVLVGPQLLGDKGVLAVDGTQIQGAGLAIDLLLHAVDQHELGSELLYLLSEPGLILDFQMPRNVALVPLGQTQIVDDQVAEALAHHARPLRDPVPQGVPHLVRHFSFRDLLFPVRKPHSLVRGPTSTPFRVLNVVPVTVY